MEVAGDVDALFAFVSFLLLPALLMLFFGVRSWYLGVQQAHEDKLRWGKMFTMFGIIFLVIIFISSYFLKGSLPG